MVFDEAGRLLDEPRHGRGVEVREVVLLDLGRHELSVLGDVLRLQVNLVGEVGFDLEQLGEVLVVEHQHTRELRVADQHDLDVERYRLRFDRGGWD